MQLYAVITGPEIMGPNEEVRPLESIKFFTDRARARERYERIRDELRSKHYFVPWSESEDSANYVYKGDAYYYWGGFLGWCIILDFVTVNCED